MSDTTTISKDPNVYGGYTLGGEGIAQMDELMMQMQLLNREFIAAMQKYNQQQQQVNWDIQIAAIQKRYESIEDEFKSSKLNSTAGIISGSLAMGGGMVGAGSAFGGAGTQTMGQGFNAMSQGGGKTTEGSMGLEAKKLGKESQKERAVADLISSNAQQYAKEMEKLTDNISKIRQLMQSMTKDVVDLMDKINNAVQIR